MSRTLKITKTKAKRKDIKYVIYEGEIVQETPRGYLIQSGHKKEFINKAAILTGDITIEIDGKAVQVESRKKKKICNATYTGRRINKLSKEEIKMIISLYKKGHKKTDIAKIVGRNITTVRNRIDAYEIGRYKDVI